MLKTIGLIGLGGGLGCIARYLQTLAVKRWLDVSFPLGTLSVNLLGSLIVGVIMGFLLKNNTHHPILFPLLVVGFCGGFTTFSSFSFECLSLLQTGRFLQAMLYISISLIVGIALTFIGFYFGQKI